MSIHVFVLQLLLLCARALPECSLPSPDHAAQLVQLDKGMRRSANCAHRPAALCTGICGWNSLLSHCQAYIAWFHPMKSGSTFGATLAHFANDSLPAFAHMPTCGYLRGPGELVEEDQCYGGNQGPYEFFAYKYPKQTWFRDVFWTANVPEDVDPGNHKPISDEDYARWKGHFVGLFRQPHSRIFSSFNHFVATDSNESKLDRIVSLRQFANRNRGAVTKMLCGEDWDSRCEFQFEAFQQDSNCPGSLCEICSREPTASQLERALQRLQGFAFVSLTEHFDLSVCLFHAIYGGTCHPVEFLNMRPGQYDSDLAPEDYLGVLKGYEDPYDGRVFQEATKLFWEKVKLYNIDAESCARICPNSNASFQ